MRALEWMRGRATQLLNDRGALTWMAVVAAVFGAATIVRSQASSWGPDHMMILASDMFVGRADLSSLTTINDIVTIDGRHYQAMSLLPTVPYLPLVPFPFLWPFSRWIVSAVIGILAGWLALPVARRYGPGGPATYWLASLGAFGTLLFTLTIEGNFYYLAHLEAAALAFLILIEWHDRRRALVLGALIGLAALARPTLGLVALPVGLALLWESKDRVLTALEFASGRSSSPSRSPGSGTSFVSARSPRPATRSPGSIRAGPLEALRAKGLFSIVHVPTNVALFLGRRLRRPRATSRGWCPATRATRSC